MWNGTVDTTDVGIPGISGSENVESLLVLMVSGEVVSTSWSWPKIYGVRIYDFLKSF